MDVWVAHPSPWEDERAKGLWYVARYNQFDKPTIRMLKDSFPNRVIGASSDGSGADLSEDEARSIASSLNILILEAHLKRSEENVERLIQIRNDLLDQ